MKYLFKLFLAVACFAGSANLAAGGCFDSCACDPCVCDPCACNPCGNCWEGFYVGGQVGYGWNHHDWKFRNANFFNTDGAIILGNRVKFDTDGVVGGGALGYNYQCGNFVVGVEGGAWGLDLRKTHKSRFFPETDRFSGRLDWLGFAKLRLGYAYDCFLAYVAGGWAGSDLRVKLRDIDLDVTAKSHKWVNGWTVGAGVEYKICSWSVGLAYDYIELQLNRRTCCRDCGEGIGFGAPRLRNTSHLQTVTFRVNYFFNLF